MAKRITTSTTTTTVVHIAKPLGIKRENGPHLVDLREFVAACEGLPDELMVWIDGGPMNESGRHDVTIKTIHREPADQEATS